MMKGMIGMTYMIDDRSKEKKKKPNYILECGPLATLVRVSAMA